MHGGELTLGAIDEPMRRTTTKMAHLHFVSTEVYAERVRQLGGEDWRITVSGAPSLDNLDQIELTPAGPLLGNIPAMNSHPLSLSFHPETRNYWETGQHVRALLQALEQDGGPVIFTAPIPTPTVRSSLRRSRNSARSIQMRILCTISIAARYFSLMSCARAMVGNSSSGIVESGSFQLPVVDIGDRPKGRLAGPNVTHVEPIASAILGAQGNQFWIRASIKGMKNPYGDGKQPKELPAQFGIRPDRKLIEKGFVDR